MEECIKERHRKKLLVKKTYNGAVLIWGNSNKKMKVI